MGNNEFFISKQQNIKSEINISKGNIEYMLLRKSTSALWHLNP